MNAPNSTRSLVWIAAAALAVVALAPASLLADHHFPGRDDPWNSGNCTLCHGADLTGASGPSCMSCHNDFTEPDPPASGHHFPGRMEALTNCTLCHGADLTGGIGPSCFTCHDQLWNDGGGGNSPPNVDIGGPYSGAPGEEIQFDASQTTDPDGDTMTYLWLFGDGSPPQFPSQNPTIAHTYQNAGTYTVTLTVTDGVNNPIIVTTTIEIESTTNSPPTADPGGPYSGTAGQALQFNGSGSSDPDGDALSYVWDFGDGTAPSQPSGSPTISHTFAQAGTYTVELSVADGVNAPAVATVQVVVAEPPPGGNGDQWAVQVPYLFADFTVEMENFAGIILFETTLPDGEVIFGIGMETDGTIFWMDVNGAIFFGNIDRGAGTMRGVVFDYAGGSSIWFGERL